jgi:hypothetical protein
MLGSFGFLKERENIEMDERRGRICRWKYQLNHLSHCLKFNLCESRVLYASNQPQDPQLYKGSLNPIGHSASRTTHSHIAWNRKPDKVEKMFSPGILLPNLAHLLGSYDSHNTNCSRHYMYTRRERLCHEEPCHGERQTSEQQPNVSFLLLLLDCMVYARKSSHCWISSCSRLSWQTNQMTHDVEVFTCFDEVKFHKVDDKLLISVEISVRCLCHR